jgi:molybdopterin converting factor small subunit
MAAAHAAPGGGPAPATPGAAADGTPRGTIRYWAAAKAAAGIPEEPYEATTLAEALDAARHRHAGDREFARVLTRCSYLVDGDPVGTRDHGTVALAEGGTVEVLPPFAGG